MATDFEDAARKIVAKYLENYEQLKKEIGYWDGCCNIYERENGIQIDMSTLDAFEKHLVKKIIENQQNIECLETSFLEIEEQYM